MATDKQAAYFLGIYEKEGDRTKSLRDIAKVYIGLTSIYSGFLIFTTEKARPFATIHLIIYVGCIALFIAAFLCAVQVLQVAAYERPSDPYKIINAFGDSPPSDDIFFDHRIIDLTVAAGRNALVNDRKAKYLSASGHLILLGLISHATYFVIWVTGRTG